MNNQLSDNVNDHYPFTDLMLFVLYLISISLALTSNSIILSVFIRKRKASPTYNLMSNMAISDMLSAFFILLQWYFCSNIFFSNQSTNSTTLNDLNINNFSSLNNFSNEQSNLILDLNANSSLSNILLSLSTNQINNRTDSTGRKFERSIEKNDLDVKFNYRPNDEINSFLNANKSELNNYEEILRNQLNQLSFINDLTNQDNRNDYNENQNMQLNNLKANKIDDEKFGDKILFKATINQSAFDNQIKLSNQLLSNEQNKKQINDQNDSKVKSINKQHAIKTNFQPSTFLDSELTEKINPINGNINGDQGKRIVNEPLNNHQNNHRNDRKNDQINHRIALLNDQIEVLESLVNQRTYRQDLIIDSLESEEKLRKKRNSEKAVDQFAKQSELFEMTTTVSNDQELKNEKTLNDSNDLDKEQVNKESKFRNFVNQLLSSNKLIKSQFVSKMPNCGQRICGILEVLQMTFYYVSTLSMTGIAYNRNQLINRPLAPKMDTALFIITIWLTSLSMAFVISLSSLRVFVFFVDNRFISCQIILNSSDGWSLRKWRAMVLVLVQYILPLSCICYFYVNVIKELRKSNLVRTKHQSSTSSNNQSIENCNLMNRRISSATTVNNYNSIVNAANSLKQNSNFIESNASKKNLADKSELNNNQKPNDQTKIDNASSQFKLSSLNFKSINLVNLPLVKKFNKQSIDDLTARQYYAKNKTNNQQLNKILGKKLVNGRQMNKQSSNESQNTFSSSQSNSQSVSHKLNLLDSELDRTKRRLTNMMIVVVVLFASAWLPIHVFHIKQFFIDIPQDVNYCNSSFIYLFFYWIAFSTFAYNPIIYMYFSKELRRDSMQTLKSLKSLFKLRNFKSFKV